MGQRVHETIFFYEGTNGIVDREELFDRHVPRKPHPLRRGPCLPAGRKGHNIKGSYLAGKPRPLGRGASLSRYDTRGATPT